MAALSSPHLTFSGVVLAGGKSSRMGRNKSLLLFEGIPLWERQFKLLDSAGAAEKRISLRRDDDWAPTEIARVFDDGSAGPLGGLLAVLETCSSTHVMVLAVDLPALPVSWFNTLRRRCRNGSGAVGWRSDAEAYEPLAAIYPRELFSHARQAWRRGEFSLQTLITGAVDAGLLYEQAIARGQLSWFVNWNRPEDVVTS